MRNAKASSDIEPKRLDALLNAFAGRRILVAGDLMLDEYISGQASRVSPEAPVLVVDVQQTTHALGGAANVAGNVREMGAEVSVAGIVGRDPGANLLLASLEAHGCCVENVIVADDRPTTVKTRVVVQNQQVLRFDRETRKAVSEAAGARLLALVEAALPAVDAVILSDYAKGALTHRLVTAIIRKAKQRRVPLAANLKPPHVEAFCGATFLTLNQAEAERAWRQPIVDETSLYRCGHALRKRLACKGLLITRGGEGVVLFTQTGAPHAIPTRRVQVFDVTGAGDTVISAAAMALAAGATCHEAAVIGNLAGNIKVTKLGAAAVNRSEIRRFVKEDPLESSCHETIPDLGRPLRAVA